MIVYECVLARSFRAAEVQTRQLIRSRTIFALASALYAAALLSWLPQLNVLAAFQALQRSPQQQVIPGLALIPFDNILVTCMRGPEH